MRLCEGDSLQYDKVINSPVSLYISKLQHYTDIYKAEKKAQDKERRKAKQVGKKR